LTPARDGPEEKRIVIRPPADPNAACPCGSGRKYKNCHGRAGVGLSRPVALPVWGLVTMLVVGGAAGWLLHVATRSQAPSDRVVSAPPGTMLPSPGAASTAAPDPSPYAYDPRTNKYWDPNHRHWHNGLPPSASGDTSARALASAATGSPAPGVRIEPVPEPSPWSYDPATQRYWDPRHKHWHNGPSPSPAQRESLMAMTRRDTSRVPAAAPARVAPATPAADTTTGGGP
jgi:hypothetical protein